MTVNEEATLTAVSRKLLRRLGVMVRRSTQSWLADGSRAPVDSGCTVIRLDERASRHQ